MANYSHEWKKVFPPNPYFNYYDPEPFAFWKSLRSRGAKDTRFLIQFPPESTGREAALKLLGLESPPIYGSTGTCFWTLRPKRADVDAGLAAPAAATLPPWWYRTRLIGAAESMGAEFECKVDLDLEPPKDEPLPEIEAAPAAGDGARCCPAGLPVLAVIDTTCAFLHCTFRKRGDRRKTRLRAVWAQDADDCRVAPWTTPKEFGYGWELRQADIDAKIDESLQPGASQRAVYSAMGIEDDIPDPTMPWSHGTHVLAIAGGTSDPFAAVDAASDLELIAVQLPSEAVDDSHGVWLNAYVLDGLNYILCRAPADAPVIVNISLAGTLGSHDGHSVLEDAITELIERYGGRLIVVMAAGNERVSAMHTVLKPNSESRSLARFTLTTVPDIDAPHFADMWSRKPEKEPAAAVALDMKVTVSDGGGLLAEPVAVAPGEGWALYKAASAVRPAAKAGEPVAMACLSRNGRAVNGRGIQAFLAMASAASPNANGAPPSPMADWTVELCQSDGPQVEVDVWLGRDDLPAGDAGRQIARRQMTFSCAPSHRERDRRGTMNSIACGRGPIVVGAYSAPSLQEPAMEPDSGEGDGRCMPGPRLSGLTAFGSEPGAPDVWFYSDTRNQGGLLHAQRGTSIAAPFVARRIANVLAAKDRAPMSQDEMLCELHRQYGVPNLSPPGCSDWTGKFWVGIFWVGI